MKPIITLVSGDFNMSKRQEGIHTSVFRHQPDGSWKYWRKMWTDVRVEDRLE